MCALRCPGLYSSVSAFAPICAPTMCAWGKKAFTGYLGADEAVWNSWDASQLVRAYQGPPLEILVDQVSALQSVRIIDRSIAVTEARSSFLKY